MFALRFRAYGQRQYVHARPGEDGWTAARRGRAAERARRRAPRNLEPPEPEQVAEAAAGADVPRVRVASGSTENATSCGRAPSAAYEWRLTHHLLPFFARHRLSQITVEEVDRYRAARCAERDRGRRRLSNESINKTLTRLGADPRGCRRVRLPRPQPRARARVAGCKGRKPRRGSSTERSRSPHCWTQPASSTGGLARIAGAAGGRCSATLVYGGPADRGGARAALADVDLAGGRLRIGGPRPTPGVRDVPLLPALRDELAAHKAQARYTGTPRPRVLHAVPAGALSKDNTRQRILQKAIEARRRGAREGRRRRRYRRG